MNKPEIIVKKELYPESENLFYPGNIVEYLNYEDVCQKPYLVMVVQYQTDSYRTSNSYENVNVYAASAETFKGVIIDGDNSDYSLGKYCTTFLKKCFKQFHGTITIKI